AIDAKAVISAVTVEAAANGFDFLGDLLGIAGARALKQHFACQLGQAAVRGSLGEDASLKDGAKLDERQPMVFFDQQTESITELKLLNRALVRDLMEDVGPG